MKLDARESSFAQGGRETFTGTFKKCRHFFIIREDKISHPERKQSWDGLKRFPLNQMLRSGTRRWYPWKVRMPGMKKRSLCDMKILLETLQICISIGLYFVISWSVVVCCCWSLLSPQTTTKPLILKEHGDKWDTSCFWQTRHLDQSCLGCKWYSKVSCKGIMIQLEHQEHHRTKCIDLEAPRRNEHMLSPPFPPEYQPPTSRTDQKVLYIHAQVVGFVLECRPPPRLHNAHSSLCCWVKCVFDRGFHPLGPQLSNWFWIQPIQWTRRWNRDAYWQASLDFACPFLANLTQQKMRLFSLVGNFLHYFMAFFNTPALFRAWAPRWKTTNLYLSNKNCSNSTKIQNFMWHGRPCLECKNILIKSQVNSVYDWLGIDEVCLHKIHQKIAPNHVVKNCQPTVGPSLVVLPAWEWAASFFKKTRCLTNSNSGGLTTK